MSQLKIYYGIDTDYYNVSNICLNLIQANKIVIPSNDMKRAKIFGDPIVGKKKQIIIQVDFLKPINIEEYQSVIIDLNNLDVIITDDEKTNNDATELLQNIHKNIKIHYGNMNEEYMEQFLVTKYLKPTAKVLEIGGNIGRNSLVISSILNDSSNLVVLECDVNSANKLEHNKNLNNFNFHIENSALSARNLIQKDWDTLVSDVLLDGYTKVNTIVYDDLQKKYNIDFDTLVLDCEGAFYNILIDFPEILNNIKLIIMENDYHVREHKDFVDKVLVSNNFYRIYYQEGGWEPCYDIFYEVWSKN